MVIELRVVQFWSEIILVISNRTRAILKSRVWFQTKLHSTHFNYHYESLDNAIDWAMISLAIMVYEPLYHAHHICNICSWKSVVFTNNVGTNSRYFVGVFNKTIIPLVLACWIWDDHSKLGATHLVGYLLSHIQRALAE